MLILLTMVVLVMAFAAGISGSLLTGTAAGLVYAAMLCFVIALCRAAKDN